MDVKEYVVCEKIKLAKREEKKKGRGEGKEIRCTVKREGQKNLKPTSTSTSSTSYRLC